MSRLRILTWHVHGSYLASLAQVPHDWYLPVKAGRPEGYGGKGSLTAGNLHEVPTEEVADLEVDVVLTQSPRNWAIDRREVLSPAQLAGPRIHLEHDPPQEHPTNTAHPVNDPDTLVVHVTAFNQLMWDCGATPTRVIEHGVVDPGIRATGELARGLVVVNHLARRGRRLGADVFARVRAEVPLDLVGMGAGELGGVGEVPPDELAAFSAPYRFFFHPIRYTSLGLAVCEAMMLGLPVVGLATTELVTVVDDGHSGYVHTDPDVLVGRVRDLLADADLARALGDQGRRVAQRRFGIDRFVADWDQTLQAVTSGGAGGLSSPAGVSPPDAALAEATA
ncbi:glycosyltransferase family 4 protein [soil metagenome]